MACIIAARYDRPPCTSDLPSEGQSLETLHLLTLDIDWAPDWMVADAADALTRRGVRATWFATHASPVLADLLSEPLFEVGLHPNFLPGSSHGATPGEVVRHLLALVPGARSVRAHSLFQSERHSQLLAEEFGLRTDCSVLLMDADHVAPHRVRFSDGGPWLTRVPHVFQDNMFMFTGRPWTFDDPAFHTPGLKVFDFHPVHLALNSPGFGAYAALKTAGKPLASLARQDVAAHRFGGAGAATLFEEVVNRARGASLTIDQYVDRWQP
ncbi:polysaccharide deacetylase WbmS family protein [Ramlibacter sp. AN1133]|uniref:polysaccharide deacetylase WbmS family protein n=1 Tax=Ramlibacter sp. AN1133 TaxID=3133429 RepID=UPI0030C45ADF